MSVLWEHIQYGAQDLVHLLKRSKQELSVFWWWFVQIPHMACSRSNGGMGLRSAYTLTDSSLRIEYFIFQDQQWTVYSLGFCMRLTSSSFLRFSGSMTLPNVTMSLPVALSRASCSRYISALSRP